jgi:hypothetical protein
MPVMDVNKQILLDKIKSQGITEERARVFYDWSTPVSQDLIDVNASNGAVFNLFVDPEKYFIDSNISMIYEEAMLAFPSQFGMSSSLLDGSGSFDGESSMFITGSSKIKEWTAFFDISSNCPTAVEKSKSRILFSNKKNLNSSEGFSLCLNGANSLSYEFINSNGERNVKTFDRPIGEHALVIVSRINSELSLNVYDPVYKTVDSKILDISEKESSNLFCIGGFQQENLQSNTEYTGFNGEINNFVLIDQNISPAKINIISDAFFLTDYKDQYYKDVVSAEPAPGKTVQTQIKDGLEIVGYAYQQKTIEGAGQNISIFEKIPVKKPKLKTVTQFKPGEGTVTKITPTLVEEEKTYDENHLRTYSEKCILLDVDANKADTVEIYSFNEVQNNLNKKATFNTGDDTFRLDQSYSSEININIYLDGKIQEKDVDYQILNENTIKKLSGKYSELDELIYDIADTGSEPAVGLDFNEYSGDIYWYGFNDKDVYLDGKKLVYGLHYEYFIGVFLVLHGTGLSSGRMLFVDRHSSEINTNYSDNKYTHCQSFNIVSEKVWIGGLRSTEGSGYSLTCSCNLNNSDNLAQSNESLIYNNEGSFFNIY